MSSIMDPDELDLSTLSAEELRQLTGLESPVLDTSTEASYDPGAWQSFVAGLAGLREMPMPAPRTFGEGLVYGAGRGLGTAGARAEARRAKFETQAAERSKERARANLEATKEYRTSRASAVGRLLQEQRTAKREGEKYERDNPVVTDEMIAAHSDLAWLPRFKGKNIPFAWLKPENEKSLAQIEAEAKARARGAAGAEEAPVLSPEGLTAAARLWAKTGNMPPMGFGAKATGVRQQIINRAVEIFGPDLDVARTGSEYRGLTQSLTMLQRMYHGTNAFEATALKNSEVLKETMAKIPNTSSPFLNKPIRALSERGAGSAEIAAFHAARQIIIPEFARILQSPTMAGVLTVEARREIEAIARGDYSINQMMATIDVLKRDARNRRTSYSSEIDVLKKAIHGLGGEPEGPGAAEGRTPMSDEEAYQEYLRIVGSE